MPEIAIADIETCAERALFAHGADAAVAATMGAVIADAEARGNRICGLYYLESYCQQLRSGRVSGTVVPVVTTPRPGTVRVDAGFGFAQLAFLAGLPHAVAAAKANGTAQLLISHAHTATALGWFTRQLAAEGLIALGMTNAAPFVAAPGGKARVIGTNPFACSVPDGQGGLALDFDFATTQVALGRITMAQAAGETIPEGWAVDSEGKPTTDPDAALAGSLVSAGGYKGWGIGLMVEVFAAAMTGSLNALDIQPLKAPEGAPHDIGVALLISDPGVSPDFAARMARLSEVIAADTGRMPGTNKVLARTASVPEPLWDLCQSLSQQP